VLAIAGRLTNSDILWEADDLPGRFAALEVPPSVVVELGAGPLGLLLWLLTEFAVFRVAPGVDLAVFRDRKHMSGAASY